MEEKKLTPDFGRIKAHLEVLFSGYDLYKDGLIEIAYTPPDSAAVNQSRLFDLSELEEAALFAYNINNTAGRNVYVGAAVRSPDADRAKRSSLTDFYACNVAWVDLDDEGATDGIKDKYKDLPPSHVVVTGKHPYTRAQLWWKLDDPQTNKDIINNTLEKLCQHFGGDPAVVDPARVMRLGGTIAWPKKEGRIPEATISNAPQNNTPVCSIERLHSFFPGAGAKLLLTHTPPASGVEGHKDDGKPRHILTGRLKITEMLERSKIPHQWHINMRDAVAAMVSSNWSDEQIRLACAPYCEKGADDPDLRPLIGSGRRKWSIPEPEFNIQPEQYHAETGEITPAAPVTLSATSINDIDLDNIPPREFLFGDLIGRKYVSLLVAPPGAGKSIFTMQLGLYAACGRQWGDFTCKKALNVWIYNNEEGFDEIRRRVKGCMMEAGVSKSDISGTLYIDSGENRSINLAKIAGNDVIATPDFHALKQEVIARKIDVLIVDPFAETHSVAESNNDQIKVVAALFRQIAIEADCAVLLVHHTKKYTAGDDESAGNIDTARGGGAQIGVVRRAFTLSTLTKTEAKKIGVPEENRRWFVRMDDAKSNITAPADKTTWFKFKSINIKNGHGLMAEGDSIGVLTSTNLEAMKEEFGDIVSDRSAYLLTLICELHEKNGEPSHIEMPDILDYIKSYSNLKLGTRSVRDGIKDAILDKKLASDFMYSGKRFRFSLLEGGGKNNPYTVKIFCIDR